jgi:histidyl-tRNA synthetase
MAEIKKIKPSLPKGTRDFLPAEVVKRNYIFDTIKSVFRKYGFQQIDTPAFERLETLTGKYGEEGDRLLFKILNSGDYLKDAPEADLQTKNSGAVTKHIAEKGLRYDLTVPLARYVVQHNGELVFPFKRFHIGPVWRADRPQKGRYQEFYQCDADVIGSTSLLNEVELTQIYVEVFKKLNIPVSIEVSSRKFLYGFAKLCGAEETFTEFTTIIDKEDKIGAVKVIEELNLLKAGVGDRYTELMSQINKDSEKNLNEVLNDLLLLFEKANCQEGVDGLKEIKVVLEMTLGFGSIDDKVRFSPTLARGLGYYSGIIWEVKPIGVQMGSIGGGGRYDNLTEMFGGRDMSGVGISFGIERIYDVMEELNLFPAELGETTKVLFVHFDEASEAYGFEQLQKVRAADIASEIYPGKKKLDKQMNYANDKKIPFVIVIGGDEMASGKLTLKNMKSGEQQKLSIDEIIERLR